MATTNIYYLLVDWAATSAAYCSRKGWSFFWEARDDQGEIIAGVLPFLRLFDAPLSILALESAQEASEFYDAMRGALEPASRLICDVHFGCLFWNGNGGEREGAAQDLAIETGIEATEPAWFAMNPSTVLSQLEMSRQLPLTQLARAYTQTAVPLRSKYIPDFSAFEGYLLTFRLLLEAAASRSEGIIALL